MFYLSRRGQVNLHKMKKDTFAVARDPSGLEYLYQSKDESDKNHPGDSEEAKQGKMYAKPVTLFFSCEMSI